MRRYIVYGFVVFGLAGCNTNNPAPVENVPEVKKQSVFNTSDKAILTNGNIAVAADKLIRTTGDDWSTLIKVNAESLSKSPYSNMGKLQKIYGRIYKVEELPPSMGLDGQWSELLLLTGNSNSPLGASTIDCIFHGSPDKFKSGGVATCSGYFVGTFDSANAMGGTVEALVFVGYAKTGRN